MCPLPQGALAQRNPLYSEPSGAVLNRYEIYKEVIAFANTGGGVIYVGVDNNGNAVGLRDADLEYTRISNGIRDAIMQDLSFRAAAKAFQKYGVEFSEAKYRALGITRKNDALFTNLALIISDQCAHTTKVAVFGDDANTSFKDSREFGGSVFQQLADTSRYLQLCNKTVATFQGLERIEKQDYPEEALREALLNALVHRDYSFSGSIIINVNDVRMEFISIGGLVPGLSTDDIRLGISQPRNQNLAGIFHRLRLVESYGTGIRRIYKLYENCPAQPVIEVSSNAFRIALPNMNAAAAAEPKRTSAVTPQMQKVLAYLSGHGKITEEEIRSLLGIKKTRAFNLTKTMREMGLIDVVGRGADKRYMLKKE